MTDVVCVSVSRQGSTFDDDICPVPPVPSVGSSPLLPGLTVEGAGSFTACSGHQLHTAMVHKVSCLSNQDRAADLNECSHGSVSAYSHTVLTSMFVCSSNERIGRNCESYTSSHKFHPTLESWDVIHVNQHGLS